MVVNFQLCIIVFQDQPDDVVPPVAAEGALGQSSSRQNHMEQILGMLLKVLLVMILFINCGGSETLKRSGGIMS